MISWISGTGVLPRHFHVARAFMLHLYRNAAGGQLTDGICPLLENVHTMELVSAGFDVRGVDPHGDSFVTEFASVGLPRWYTGTV